MMRDYLTPYLDAISNLHSLGISAVSEVSKVSKPTSEPFDTSQGAYIPENVLLFRARIDREPDWLREHCDEIEERAAIMEYDGGLTRESAENMAVDWGRDCFTPLRF